MRSYYFFRTLSITSQIKIRNMDEASEKRTYYAHNRAFCGLLYLVAAVHLPWRNKITMQNYRSTPEIECGFSEITRWWGGGFFKNCTMTSLNRKSKRFLKIFVEWWIGRSHFLRVANSINLLFYNPEHLDRIWFVRMILSEALKCFPFVLIPVSRCRGSV
jgi:hypothetical protein